LPETPSSISACYHYDSGDVETLPDSRHEEATGPELIAVLRQLQPEVERFLAKRHGVLASCIALPQSKERRDCRRSSRDETIPVLWQR
jgi:hypothetical protein